MSSAYHAADEECPLHAKTVIERRTSENELPNLKNHVTSDDKQARFSKMKSSSCSRFKLFSCIFHALL